MSITWSGAMRTGHRQIDEQHQELVLIANELEVASHNGAESTNLTEIFLRLKAYVIFHFGTEELLMRQAKVPYAHTLMHLQEHRDFIDWLSASELKDELDAKHAVEYLSHWLIAHIQGTDRELVRMMQRNAKKACGIGESNSPKIGGVK